MPTNHKLKGLLGKIFYFFLKLTFLSQSKIAILMERKDFFPTERDTHVRAHFSVHFRIIERKTQLKCGFRGWGAGGRLGLTAFTAFSEEDLNSVPGTQELAPSHQELQSPFLAPRGPSVPMQTPTHRHTHTHRNKSK
jgi:hypothetical protein|uniref:Uncharacterized protein n=1 Tax=Mus musculus TaxID=10090 RepID=Q8BPT9_MOUSE|nr:unnamed protein product [Mus musculus]